MILLVATAGAAGFDLERVHPAVSGSLLSVPTAFVEEEAGLGGRFFAAVSQAPLVLAGADGTETHIVAARGGGELAVRYRRGRFAGALSLPAGVVTSDVDPTAFTLGDTRLDAIARVVALGPVQLAATGDLRLPTGDPTRWSGAGRVAGGGGLVASAHGGPLTLSLVGGVDSASPFEIPGFRWGPQLTWGAGVGIRLPADVRGIAELDGSVPLQSGAGADPGEWRIGAGWRATPALDLSLGLGRGYTHGVGNPDLRLMAALSVCPLPRPPRSPAPVAPPAAAPAEAPPSPAAASIAAPGL